MSLPIETLKPLSIDPETNAESIANLQQICFVLSELIADLARIQYARSKKLGDEPGMSKAKYIGESANDLAAMLAPD
ncbi:MAG: hypothetical protein HC771_22275 [Synechococcales cyanobacterium CRU_2_2]|nr:hypothetical protein [Synechococcales cyanobacterium CRU_2_2]